MHRIVPCKQETDSERSQSTVLCVALLQITDSLDELLDWHVFVELGKVRLGGVTAVVYEGRGVGCVACYCGHDVSAGRAAERAKRSEVRRCHMGGEAAAMKWRQFGGSY